MPIHILQDKGLSGTPCSKLEKFHQALHSDKPLISERLGSVKAKNAALASLMDTTERFSQSQLDRLIQQVRELLHSYADNPVFRFFETVYHKLGTYPILLSIAPIYLWRLLVQYADPIYKQKSYMFSQSAKQVDFSVVAFLSPDSHAMQSEERTSDRHTDNKCKLYDQLVKFFEENFESIKTSDNPVSEINKPVSQHFLQKFLLANLYLYTDTGITGATLETRVPLYRLFRPLYDALHSMDGELWKQMPSNQPLTVTLEQADEFYSMKRSDNAALTFLRESQGRLPVSRRKNLPLGVCENIVREALIRQNGNPIGCIDSYIVQHKELSDFAGKSAENQDLLRLTIYRMALERAAHTLSRDLMESSMQLFDQWVTKEDTEHMWQYFFEEHREMFVWKTIADKIIIGPLRIYGRVLCRIQSLNGRWPPPSEIARESTLFVISEGAPDIHNKYLGQLHTHLLEAVYQMQPCSADSTVEYTKTALQAMQSGFTGVVLPEYTVYHEIADNARNAEAIHAALVERYLMQYKGPIQHMFEKCGEDFAVLACFHCKDLEDDTLDALSVVSFWFAQDCVHAVIIRYDDKLTHTAEQRIASLASRLAVPLFLQSDNQTYDKQCALLQKTAIFGFESSLS